MRPFVDAPSHRAYHRAKHVKRVRIPRARSRSRRMPNFDPRNIDPRLIELASREQQQQQSVLPGRGPVMMPMAMPGPGGAYNRYREMTLEEMLLENRVIFL